MHARHRRDVPDASSVVALRRSTGRFRWRSSKRLTVRPPARAAGCLLILLGCTRSRPTFLFGSVETVTAFLLGPSSSRFVPSSLEVPSSRRRSSGCSSFVASRFESTCIGGSGGGRRKVSGGGRLSYLSKRRATETSQERNASTQVRKTQAAQDIESKDLTAEGRVGDTSNPIAQEEGSNFVDGLESGGGGVDDSSSPSQTDPNYIPIMALCFVVACLSALDRVAMSVAILPLSTELHLTDTVKGQISSVFSVGYGLAILPCGLLVAALSPRLIMAAGVALWSLATFGTPLAADLVSVREVLPGVGEVGVDAAVDAVDAVAVSTFVAENVAPLLLVRAVMGAAESVVLPAIQRILANWVPPSKKSLAVAGIFTGFQFGTISAYLLSPVVIDEFGGWRGMFYLYGIVGLLWMVPWLAFAKDVPPSLVDAASADDHMDEETVLINTMREDDISLVPEHLQTMKTSAAGGEELVVEPELPSPSAFEEAVAVLQEAPWKELLTSRAVWGMTIAHAANNWGLYNNLSWTPTFYAEQYGLSVKDSAILSLLPSVAGALCGLFAGSVADVIIERLSGGGVDQRTLVRKVFQAVALFGPAACLLTLSHEIPTQPAAAQALLTGAVGLQAFNAAGYGAATQEKAAKWAGLLYSITSLPGVVFGSVGVYATGKILDATGQDWSIVFGLNAVLYLVGASAFVALYNSKKEFA